MRFLRRTSGYRCRICRARHDELPFAYGAPLPDVVAALPPSGRAARVEATDDWCVLDDAQYFIVGNLEIPVHGTSRRFSWDVWVSLSQPNFEHAMARWHDPARIDDPPMFGWLCTHPFIYPVPAEPLKTNVHQRAVGVRPFVELEPTDHPLAVEQRNGITVDRVQAIAERMQHPDR